MSSQNKKGRPTLGTQNKIKSTLLHCYEDGLSVYSAAKKTKYDIKTVYKYYNELYEDITEFETANYLQRQKQDRTQIIISYDSQIDDVRTYLSQINSEIETYVTEKKPIPRHLHGFNLDAMKFRSLLMEKKASFAMKPIMDAALKKEIEDMKEDDSG